MDLIDSVTVERNGIGYRIDLHEDDRTTPAHADCYDAADVEAWKKDEWRYVGIIVTPVIDGMDLESCSVDLWSLEYGEAPGWGRFIDLDELAKVYPGPELMDHADELLLEHSKAIRRALRRRGDDVRAAAWLLYLTTHWPKLTRRFPRAVNWLSSAL